MTSRRAESPWGEVDKWRSKQSDLFFDRTHALIRLGWLLLRTNDGLFAARRIRPDDVPGYIPDNAPEVSAPTWGQLYAEVQARAGKNGGEA